MTPLAQQRTRRGWTKVRAIHALRKAAESRHFVIEATDESLLRQLANWENGHRPLGEVYLDLFCQVYGCQPSDLLGDGVAPDAPSFALTSHKFVPVFVGREQAAKLCTMLNAETSERSWVTARTVEVDHADGDCRLYVWPFGVAVFHLVERIEHARIAELCSWRRSSYTRNRRWADEWLAGLGLLGAEANYVLSAYWVNESIWEGKQLETALRLLCIPRALHGDGETVDVAQAWQVERSMLRDGFDHPDIVSFGMKGIAHGLASWSGVVYLPLASSRALEMSEIVECELAVQAVWAYCAHLREEVESGREPEVPAEFGWRYLRGIKSRLTTERPTETAQQRAMREAVVVTSGLDRHMDQAIDILRESERR